MEKFDTQRYRVWTWKHPFMLHWIINPGLAFNELVLGQRVPKVMLIEKDSSKSLQEKTWIPCPHCNTMHNGMKWSSKTNAFGNWYGYYCDQCGGIIPCLRNAFSFLILLITYPFRLPFEAKWKEKWLAQQPQRFQNLDVATLPNPLEGYGWIKLGLKWGASMYIFLALVLPLIMDGEIELRKTLIGIPVWAFAGLLFGFLMKLIAGKKKVK